MKFPITPKGLEKIKQELVEMKAQRPIIAEEIATARGHGDLSENADYDAAREKSGMLEARIRDYEARIGNAEVIDPSLLKDYSKVVFGVRVKLDEINTGETKIVTILGSSESDTSKGIISYDTPLAKALIGKAIGEVAEIRLPAGLREYEIIDISVAE